MQKSRAASPTTQAGGRWKLFIEAQAFTSWISHGVGSSLIDARPDTERGMKRWLMVIAASIVSMEAYAQTNTPTGMDFYQSCMAAAGIVGGHPLPTAHAMKEEVELAQTCFAAVTAVMELEPLLAPPYRMCPSGTLRSAFRQRSQRRRMGRCAQARRGAISREGFARLFPG